MFSTKTHTCIVSIVKFNKLGHVFLPHPPYSMDLALTIIWKVLRNGETLDEVYDVQGRLHKEIKSFNVQNLIFNLKSH